MPTLTSHGVLRFPCRSACSTAHATGVFPQRQLRKCKEDLQMKTFSSLCVALVVATTLAVVPAANAQTVHFAGAGSSAMFQGFGAAAYNDLATPIVSANPG